MEVNMAKKRRKKQERVVTKVASLTPKDWGSICRLPWTHVCRILIGTLFAGDGTADAATACEGTWSRVMQANRMFIKHGLPFRIRAYDLPEEEVHYTGYHIQKLGLKIHVVTETLREG